MRPRILQSVLLLCSSPFLLSGQPANAAQQPTSPDATINVRGKKNPAQRRRHQRSRRRHHKHPRHRHQAA
jgi:hypothetical protein